MAFAFDDFRLLLMHSGECEDVQEFGWYDESYDKGYQGIVGVTEIPSSRNLIVSIQRDSRPVVYDPVAQQVVRKLTLADRGGNPEFLILRSASEFWASDYDCIVKLDSSSFNVKQTLLIQGSASGTRAFMGGFCFDAEEKICAIARPFSRDVIMLAPETMRVVGSAKLEGQPLEIGLMAEETLIARDWKTGHILSARLRQC